MDKIYVKNKHLFKNKLQMVLYLIIFCVIIYLFIYLGAKDYKKDIPSNERFASNFSMVSTDNVFKYVNASDARMVAKGKKGIVLFGTKNEWVNYYAYIVNKVAKEVGIDEVYYYDFVTNRKDNNGTYQDIVKTLSNYVANIYAPTLLVVCKDQIIYFDSETSFVKGEVTPSSYWNGFMEGKKEQELKTVFKEYLES